MPENWISAKRPRLRELGVAASAGWSHGGREREKAAQGDEGGVRNGTSGCVEGLQRGRQREGKSWQFNPGAVWQSAVHCVVKVIFPADWIWFGLSAFIRLIFPTTGTFFFFFFLAKQNVLLFLNFIHIFTPLFQSKFLPRLSLERRKHNLKLYILRRHNEGSKTVFFFLI